MRLDGPSVAVLAVAVICAIFFFLGIVGLWLTSRRRIGYQIGRWYCTRCRVVWRGATTSGRTPKHGCGQWMIPSSGSADELD